jgi:hypothetical protein
VADGFNESHLVSVIVRVVRPTTKVASTEHGRWVVCGKDMKVPCVCGKAMKVSNLKHDVYGLLFREECVFGVSVGS